MRPEGIGRVRVRAMTSSMSRSKYMLTALAPPASVSLPPLVPVLIASILGYCIPLLLSVLYASYRTFPRVMGVLLTVLTLVGGRIVHEPLRGGIPAERAARFAGDVREVIVATNPRLEGEATALYVQEQVAPYGVSVTRLARGLPVGGDLEYADGGTIAQAISARRAMQ